MGVGIEPNVEPGVREFATKLETIAPKGLRWKFAHMKNETHVSLPLQGLYRGLLAIYADWLLPPDMPEKGAKMIQKHYRKLTWQFGYTIEPSFEELYFLGMRFLRQKKVAKAIDIFLMNVQKHPKNWIVYSSLGEAYYMNKEVDKAIIQYEKALQLNPKFEQGKDILEKLKKSKKE